MFFTNQTQYDDNYGRIKGSIYPTGITLESRYNDRGYLTEQRNGQSGYVYHQVTEVDARGQVLNALKADGILTESSEYDENSGQMLSVHTHATNGGSQRHRIDYVSYDGFGNLTSQQVETTQSDGSVLTTTETYAYDNLHRLTQSALDNAINYAYDAAGNLTQKDDYASSFTYGNSTKSNRNAGPNAVYEITKVGGDTAYFDYDDNGNLLSGDGKTLTYNAFNKPISISKNNITSRFYYGSDQMRYKQVKERQSGGDETTLYIGKSYEEIRYDDKVIKKSYLGDSIITETEENNSTDYQIGFVHRDRLGSVVTITDETGQVIDNKSYDPFGKPRKANLEKAEPATLTNIASIENYLTTDNAIDLTTRRGFTDHEHLDDAELIHMNGRVYDYNLGRFLSVDPFIQAPTNSQSMNPYSYIMNNPLSGTDPSGYVAQRDQVPCEQGNIVCIKKKLPKLPGSKEWREQKVALDSGAENSADESEKSTSENIKDIDVKSDVTLDSSNIINREGRATAMPKSGGTSTNKVTPTAKAATAIGTDEAAVLAVGEVESKNEGFLPEGLPKILFEAHLFSKFTDGKFDKEHPDISSSTWDRSLYKGGLDEYPRLFEAMKLDFDAAIRATSWGQFQILGDNYKAAGFNSPTEFMMAQMTSDKLQASTFASFVKRSTIRTESLQNHNWSRFARNYNGPAFKANKYDTKLKAAYEKHKPEE